MVRGTLIIGALEMVPPGVMSQVHTQPGGEGPTELLLHRETATIVLDRERQRGWGRAFGRAGERRSGREVTSPVVEIREQGCVSGRPCK